MRTDTEKTERRVPSRLRTALKIIGSLTGILGAIGGSYMQTRSESRKDVDVMYQTMKSRVSDLEAATDYLSAELDILKAREILKEHDLPPETMAELEALLGTEGLASFTPEPAESGRRRRPPRAARRAPRSAPVGDGTEVQDATAAIKKAYGVKNRVPKPDWLGSDEKKPEMPATFEEAAEQQIWTK